MNKGLKFGVVFRAFGISIMILGVFMLTSLPFAIYYHEKTVLAFCVSSIISVLMGLILTVSTKKYKDEDIREREAFFIVSLTWIMAGFFGALPFVLSGSIPNFTNAFFESISGFTTTGASILTEIETLPKSILYWRSLTHWLGGMGILVLVIAVLPKIGFGGVRLFVAEAPGPSGSKIHPKIKQTALRLWGIYTLLTVLLIILLMAGGMNFFESICHSMGTLSTGGFSPKNTSIADYSAYIQVVITIFMFFGGVNFALHYFLLKGRLKKFFFNEEWLLFAGLIVAVSTIVSLNLYFNDIYQTLGQSFRYGFFQCVSIITTTGFATADYMLWPQATWILLFLLFFSGGMIGSTSGGIKFTRHLVLIKNLRSEIRKQLHPNAITTIKINNKPISDDIIKNFLIVFIAYISVFFLGSLLMSFYTEKAVEAFGVTVSCLAGVGPAFGKYGPSGNYNELHDAAKWILSVIMVIGRIELFPFILIFTKSFWKA